MTPEPQLFLADKQTKEITYLLTSTLTFHSLFATTSPVAGRATRRLTTTKAAFFPSLRGGNVGQLNNPSPTPSLNTSFLNGDPGLAATVPLTTFPYNPTRYRQNSLSSGHPPPTAPVILPLKTPNLNPSAQRYASPSRIATPTIPTPTPTTPAQSFLTLSNPLPFLPQRILRPLFLTQSLAFSTDKSR